MTAMFNHGTVWHGTTPDEADGLSSPSAMGRLAHRELERAERHRRVCSIVLIEMAAGDAQEPTLAAHLRTTCAVPTPPAGWTRATS